MNRGQKILTVMALVALGVWAIMFNDDMSVPRYSNPAGDLGILGAMAAAYVAVMFMLRKPKK